jgi:hypothetical protein
MKTNVFGCVLQNSPEVDEEGYSLRPDEEEEAADILMASIWMCSMCTAWHVIGRSLEPHVMHPSNMPHSPTKRWVPLLELNSTCLIYYISRLV